MFMSLNNMIHVWVQVLSSAGIYDWDHKFIINRNKFYLKPHNHEHDEAIEDVMEFGILPGRSVFWLLFEFRDGKIQQEERYLFYDKKEAIKVFNQVVNDQELYNNKGFQVIERKWDGDMMSTLYKKNYKGVYEWTDKSSRWVLKTCIVQ